MKQQSIFEALVKLSKKGVPQDAAEEAPLLKRRDQRSPRARARNAAHHRALARGVRKQTKFVPKKRWPSIGRRGGAQPPPGASVLDRIIRAMRPGAWYARSDLGHLADLTKSEIDGVRLFSHGYLTRRRNPDWKRWEAPPMERQPYWLYSLTLTGQGRQRELTRSVSS